MELDRRTVLKLCVATLLASVHATGRAATAESVVRGTHNGEKLMKGKLMIVADGREVSAVLADNATTRELIRRLPMMLHFEDLYGREFCHRFERALPTDDVRSRGYDVGEIVYWPPRHSFVILYKQNGEVFDMQSIGRVENPSLLPAGDFRAELRYLTVPDE